MKISKEQVRVGSYALFVLIVFLSVSYFVQSYLMEIQDYVGVGITGMAIYFGLNVIEVLFSPISILPLIPVASALWGPITAGLLTLAAWTTGSVIAFSIARYFGKRFVHKFVSLHKIEDIEKKLNPARIFLSIVTLRILIPSDILSYVLGLFSKIRLRTFAIATFIGFAPLAFSIAYLGALPFVAQASIAGTIFLLVVISYLVRLKIKEGKHPHTQESGKTKQTIKKSKRKPNTRGTI